MTTPPVHLPSVEAMLNHPDLQSAIAALSRPLVANVVRQLLDKYRQSGTAEEQLPTTTALVSELNSRLTTLQRRGITEVINGTGVLIHTNLGRAPLGEELLQRAVRRVSRYCTLEFDLESGKRGKRASFLSFLLSQLTESEAALAVNNNAAAVFLILNTFADRREVIVSRAELVQIGGGFRIPDIIRRSGAKLIEVGTTNKTTEGDIRGAHSPRTALLLKVHQSNFRQSGFVEEVSVERTAQLARELGVISVYDLGSGSWLQTEKYGMEPEPNIVSAVRSGCDLVCFSGDKLFGGAQAGMILGRRDLIERLNKNPLYRAVRLDKLTIALLEEAVLAYLRKEEASVLTLWQLITTPLAELKQRAEKAAARLQGNAVEVEVVDALSTPGGGSLPGGALASVALSIKPRRRLSEFSRRLLASDPPLVGYIDNECYLIDLRTVLPAQDAALIRVVRESA